MEWLRNTVNSLRRQIRAISRMRIGLYAANASFFITLGVFPGLVLLLGLLRSSSADPRRLEPLLRGLVPGILLEGAAALLRSADLSGISLSLSALTAAWSAGKGVHGIQTGLNAVYGLEESRGYLKTRFLSGVFTLVLMAALALILGLRFFAAAPLLQSLCLKFALPVLLQTAVYTAMYRVLPNRRTRLRSCLPGALLAAFGCYGFSALFSVYAAYFAPLTNVYGSFYALALGMLWLYCCMAIVLLGGAWNRQLQNRGRKI